MYRPDSAPLDERVLFLLHGADRNAEACLDCWIGICRAQRIIAVAPEFSHRTFGSSPYAYHHGNVVSPTNFMNARAEWSFCVIENIFDQLRAVGVAAASYSMFGHSAGAQFVHRMALFLPDARTDVAIAANAGYYTFPHQDAEFPYGLRGSAVTNSRLTRAFSKRVVVLLGEYDNDPDHPELRKSKEAMAQGTHRLERGVNYYAAAESRAAELGIKLNWQLSIVPNAGHSYRQMSDAAAEFLADHG